MRTNIVGSTKWQRKGKSIIFPFLCFLVHKRKNDKTEVIFRFSFFCVCLYIKGKTIKRKPNFVFRFCVSSFEKTKTMKRKSNFVHLFLEKDSIKQ